MRPQLYLQTLLLGLRQVVVYRTEVWLAIAIKIIRISSIAFLWSVLLKDPAVKGSFAQILPYFLVADSVQVLVGAEWIRFGRTMINEIKEGALNTLLIRPVHPIAFMYARYYGGRGVEVMTALISLALGIYLRPPESFLAIGLFLLALIVSWIVSVSINTMVGNLSFWFVEADGIKNAVNHTIRIFGGSLVPISFFPPLLKNIALASPVPILAYLPVTLLQPGGITPENLTALFISACWAVFLLPFSLKIYQKGIRHYEAIGI